VPDTLSSVTTAREDGRLKRGRETRQAILERAVDIASAEGLEGLSIARLAGELDISKSGLFAHFGSKEDLQLATIQKAREVFIREVVGPARKHPEGLPQVWAACDHRFDHMASAFSGGCFFYGVTAEFDARPGRVRDRLAELRQQLWAWLESLLERAEELGHLRSGVSPADLAFQLDAFAQAANGDARLTDDDAPLQRAREITLRVLRSAAADPSLLPDSLPRNRPGRN
jgi:AcrR family transcriptional regulator